MKKLPLLCLTLFFLACQQSSTLPPQSIAASRIAADISALRTGLGHQLPNVTQAIFYPDHSIFTVQDANHPTQATQYQVTAGKITNQSPVSLATAASPFALSLIRSSVITDVTAQAVRQLPDAQVTQVTFQRNANNVIFQMTFTAANQSKSLTADMAGNLLEVK